MIVDKYLGKYRNEPNRLQRWDYSSPGKYYITICIQNREQILCSIENQSVILSDFGKIVKNELLKIPEFHKRAILDEWIIMPDHIHMIIELGCWDYDNGKSVVGDSSGQIHEFVLKNTTAQDDIKLFRAKRRQMLLPKIIGKFKMLTSKQINIERNTSGQKLWQHDYHVRIINRDQDYLRIKQYIIENPKNW